jgi:single-strand DNA-binding protein
VRFSLATNERWNDKDGNLRETTEWHRVVVWGRQADSCQQYLTKGNLVAVEGRLRTRNWDDPRGVRRYVTEVVATRVIFLGREREEMTPPSFILEETPEEEYGVLPPPEGEN